MDGLQEMVEQSDPLTKALYQLRFLSDTEVVALVGACKNTLNERLESAKQALKDAR